MWREPRQMWCKKIYVRPITSFAIMQLRLKEATAQQLHENPTKFKVSEYTGLEEHYSYYDPI